MPDPESVGCESEEETQAGMDRIVDELFARASSQSKRRKLTNPVAEELLDEAIGLIPCRCSAPGMTCDRCEFVKRVHEIRGGGSDG